MVALRLQGLEGISTPECRLRKARLYGWVRLGALAEQPIYLRKDSLLKNESRVLPLSRALLIVLVLFLPILEAGAQSEASLAQRIEKVVSRPEFAHANF